MKPEEPVGVWERYRQAKIKSFQKSEQPETDEPLSIEQLEAAIAEAAASSGLPETGMPPRSSVHPNERGRWAKMFTRTLLLAFASLVAALLWWGRSAFG